MKEAAVKAGCRTVFRQKQGALLFGRCFVRRLYIWFIKGMEHYSELAAAMEKVFLCSCVRSLMKCLFSQAGRPGIMMTSVQGQNDKENDAVTRTRTNINGYGSASGAAGCMPFL